MFIALLVLSIILLTQQLGGISVACGIVGIVVGGIGLVSVASRIIVAILDSIL